MPLLISASSVFAVHAPLMADHPTDNGPAGTGRGESAPVLVAKTKTLLKRPSLYKVLLLNDDFTPMDFVVDVIQKFFNKSTEEATMITAHVHNNGVGLVGVYSLDVAESKSRQVVEYARQHGHPLQCALERS